MRTIVTFPMYTTQQPRVRPAAPARRIPASERMHGVSALPASPGVRRTPYAVPVNGGRAGGNARPTGRIGRAHGVGTPCSATCMRRDGFRCGRGSRGNYV